MPKPEDHIQQARNNLKFLERVNGILKDSYDWQVTICFYSAVHLVNYHLAHNGQQYRSHTQIKNALNPASDLAPFKLPEDQYIAYEALRSMSRRSRYLVSESDKAIGSDVAAFTYSKHLARAVRHLDTLLNYFGGKYSLEFALIQVVCDSLKSSEPLTNFTVGKQSL